MPNTPHRHHYVPQLLLQNFADAAGSLWVYDTEQGKCWKTRPKSAGFEGNFYARDLKGDKPEYSAIENFLGDNIDSPGADAIKGLLARECLSGERWWAFLGFVAAQMQRTPMTLERQATALTPVLRESFRRMANYSAEFKERLLARGMTENEIARMVALVNAGKMTVTPHRDHLLTAAIRMIETIADELSQMQWTFLAVPVGEPDLIIGDHPVTLADPVSNLIGLRNPNIELLLPLSLRMVACARRDGPNSYGDLAPGMSQLINERTLGGARRFIFAGAQSDELLKDALRFRGTGPGIQTRQVRAGKGLIHFTEFRYPDATD